MIPIRELSNPAAMAFEWQHPITGTRYQLVWARGDSDFVFGVQAPEHDWSFTRVRNRAFRPSTPAEARRMARAFVDAGERAEQEQP